MNRPMRGPSAPPPRDGGIHTIKAVLVILVVVVVGFVILHHEGKTTPSAAGSPATTVKKKKSTTTTTILHSTVPTSPPTTLLAASAIKLQVLNGVGSGSLAGEWSTKLRTQHGYDTLSPDNATAKVASSVIYVITPGYEPEADLLATQVGLTPAIVQSTVPATAPIRASEKANANIVLIIGPNLAGTA